MSPNIKQYNKYYKNIFYEGKPWRIYDESTTNSYTVLFSETSINLIRMIRDFNFKLFYINCSPKCDLSLGFLKPNHIDVNNSNVKIIKEMLKQDMYFIYENQIFEVIWKIPLLNKNNNYYYNILLLVNESFDINTLYKHNFNLINIENINQINISDITYEWVEKIFNNRNVFNNCIPSHELEMYDLGDIDLSEDDYIRYYKNGDKSKLNFEEYNNISSKVYYKNLNQNDYVSHYFKLLDFSIWSFDRHYIKEKNKFGFLINYINKYNMSPSFLTNFGELSNCMLVNIKGNLITTKNLIYTYSDLVNSYDSQCIMEGTLDKSSVKTGYACLENLEEYDSDKMHWLVYSRE